ncbi:hypothetical protein ACLOJK_005293 [Asimina triloba]
MEPNKAFESLYKEQTPPLFPLLLDDKLGFHLLRSFVVDRARSSKFSTIGRPPPHRKKTTQGASTSKKGKAIEKAHEEAVFKRRKVDYGYDH